MLQPSCRISKNCLNFKNRALHFAERVSKLVEVKFSFERLPPLVRLNSWPIGLELMQQIVEWMVHYLIGVDEVETSHLNFRINFTTWR